MTFQFLLVKSVVLVLSETMTIPLLSLSLSIINLILLFFTYRKDKRAELYKIVAQYNFEFITNPNFTEVERRLEICYQTYRLHRQEYPDRKSYVELCEKVFDNSEAVIQDNVILITEERQHIINYLVYLEAFSSLVISGMVKLKDIDDLFGYRFFITVNNPYIQNIELVPEEAYYRGCHKAYVKWRKYREKHGLDIPLVMFELSAVDENI